MPAAADPFTVLFVCTGNICRSPMAERLFLTRLRPLWPVTASSAGTAALVGHPIDPAAAFVLAELGAEGGEHHGRRLAADLVAGAGLVLTATRAQRASVLEVDARALRRSFTLREFGRLGQGADPPGLPTDLPDVPPALRQRVDEVAAQRGRVPGTGSDDIGDPFGAPLAVMRRCAREVADAVDAVCAVLGLP